MNMKISPKNLSGEVAAIPSKSQAHRVMIAAALSGRPIAIGNISEDIEATKECLAGLMSDDSPVLNCRESGSALRFLLPISMALKNKATFIGAGELPNRPLSPLKEQLEAHGCVFTKEGDEICTLTGALTGGTFTLPGNVTSQFITGLLFALPLLDENSEIFLSSPLQSASYVTMTLSVLEMFGVKIESIFDENNAGLAYSAFRIKGKQQYICPEDLTIEGDWSNAAFWLAAGVISSSSDHAVTCSGLNRFSEQGDKKIVSILNAFGGKVSIHEGGVTASPGDLRGIEIDASDVPDLIPVLSVVASVSQGMTTVINAERLRIKESDRLHAIYDCLSRLGADVEEFPGSLAIKGKEKLKGGVVSGYNDHRMVMSMAIASICCENPVIIEGAAAVNKSYPHFFDDFTKLGGDAVEL